jgi:hypothetical protein
MKVNAIRYREGATPKNEKAARFLASGRSRLRWESD